MFDSCKYCDRQMHPLPVWVLARVQVGKKPRIHVCRHPDCEEQADDDGYEKREDLTPSR